MTKELETHEIQTMLSRPETAFGLSRRKFLIGALATAGAVVANPYLAGAQTLASASTAKFAFRSTRRPTSYNASIGRCWPRSVSPIRNIW